MKNVKKMIEENRKIFCQHSRERQYVVSGIVNADHKYDY
jgi:hypothetical protein